MGSKSVRRLLTTTAATVAIVGLAAAPASAHFCFNTKMSERAQQAAEGSPVWVSFEDLATEVTGLCPAGVQILADASGAELDSLINTRATMAGGTTMKEDPGTPGISHLDFEAIDAAFPEAAAACE